MCAPMGKMVKVVETRSLKKYKSHKFSEDLKHHFEYFKLKYTDPNELWELWKSTSNFVFEKHVPMRLKNAILHLGLLKT